MIPLSVEVELPGGLGTDLPSEPLMWLLTGLGGIWFLYNLPKIKFQKLYHPITGIILLHLAWILVSTITSQNVLVSIKYLLAKSWYVVVFYFLPFVFLRKPEDFKKLILAFLTTMLATIVYVMVRHQAEGFSFAEINAVLSPFYRNHVSYACAMVVFLPFVWLLRNHYDSKRAKNFLTAICIILLIAIYFSYTRAAYVCVPLMIGYYFAVRWKLTRFLIPIAIIGAIGFVSIMAKDNKYIDFAPDYQKTIAHYQFDDLVSATYKFEDISTMERFYRWIAGFYMIAEKPMTGFGPGNFYNYYHSYTDQNFVTYVSHNPEKSGVHNYYLMVLVEQGLAGVLIFLSLCILFLLRAERLYHRLVDKVDRSLLLAAILSMISILFCLLLNDMVETDKVGSFFFINLAILVILETKRKRQLLAKTRLSDSKG